MNENKGIRLPHWLLKLLPMWDWICPSCRKEVKQKSHKCIHCGENYGMPLRVPPKVWEDVKALETYVHEYVFPRVSQQHRDYLTQFFTVLFSDGQVGSIMETLGDFSAWTGTAGTPTVVGVPVHHGSNAAEFNANGERIWKTFANQNVVYARVYFRTTTLQTGGGSDSFAEIYNSTDGYVLVAVGIKDFAGTQKFLLDYLNSANVLVSVTSTAVCVANTWYCVEFYFSKNTVGGAILYIDGIDVANCGVNTTADWVSQQLNVGCIYIDDATTNYIDCVVVADTRIGCEGVYAPKGTIAIHCKIAEII